MQKNIEYKIHYLKSYNKYTINLFKEFLREYNAYNLVHNLYMEYHLTIFDFKKPYDYIRYLLRIINPNVINYKDYNFLLEIFDLWILEIVYNKYIIPYDRISAAQGYNNIHRRELESRKVGDKIYMEYKRLDINELQDMIRHGK